MTVMEHKALPTIARVTETEVTQRHWVPKPSGGADPAGHLSPADFEDIAKRLDAMRQEVLDTRGARDAKYIRSVISWQRRIEIGSRAVLLFSGWRPAWVVGTVGLSVAKILDNMEIGHNVMHGQWDWMRDPKIHSTTWDWDNAAPAELWKHSHNVIHHTYTNVIGRDNDLGYGILRLDPDQRWSPFFFFQPLWNVVNASVFEYSIALYDLEIGRIMKGKFDPALLKHKVNTVIKKVSHQVAKDYVVWPLLSGPNALSTLTANAVANLVRNIWTHGVIICGHFPVGVQTFAKASLENETRGEWYVRQMLGSANISGGPLMHLMTGNLSHQIEHHLFPDLPSNRYAELAPKVRALMDEYQLPYVSGPFLKQYGSAWRQVMVYAVPNGTWQELRENPVKGLGRLVRRMLPGGSPREERKAGGQ